jgi:hypothetical protein
MRGIDGVEIFTEGKAPSAMQKGWLYVSAPQATQTIGTTYALYGPDRVSLHGDREAKAGQPARFPRNGLANGDLDIAVLAPQTIYLKLYVAGTRMSEVIWTAIALGAQRAMALTGGNVTTKEWVPEAGTRYNEERAKRAKTAEAAVEQQKALIKASADAILNAQLALEMAQEEFDNYSKKLKASDLMKELPALEMVEWVNRDDPYKTVVKTKDLVLHGVNLGGYVITFVHNTMNVAVMGTKVAPEGIVHPNIWQEKGKWQQDIPKDRLNELIAAMGAGNIHLAANLIITNLMNCPNSGDHAKRLEALRVAIATKDEQVKAKAARKAKKAEAVPVETKEPIKEVVA